MKYAWIGKNKATWPITLACEVLGVSVSGYSTIDAEARKPARANPLARG